MYAEAKKSTKEAVRCLSACIFAECDLSEVTGDLLLYSIQEYNVAGTDPALSIR